MPQSMPMALGLSAFFTFGAHLLLHLSSQCSARPILPQVDDVVNPSKYLFRQNFVTREYYFMNMTKVSDPDPVRRIRFFMSSAQATTSSADFVDLYRLRVRWVDPENWGDSFNDSNRFYELRCEVEDEKSGTVNTFLALNIDSSVDGYDESFMIRQGTSPWLRCGIRVHNSYGLFSMWRWTPGVRLHRMNRRKKFRSAGNKGFFPLAKNPLSIVHYGPAAGKGLSPHFAKNNDPSDPSSPNNDGEYLLANNPPPPRNSPRWELYKPGETINFS